MRNDAKKILSIVLTSLFFLFIVGFIFFRSYHLIFGIKIKNVNIVDGARYNTPTIDITGNAKNAKNLTLNGREISLTRGGDFSETIALLPGYNIITIKAVDEFGHVDEKDFRLIGGFTDEAK
jgi:hypothetical protein